MRVGGWLGGLMVVGVLCAGCTTSGGSLGYDPNDPGGASATPALPGQFSQAQGTRGWYYQQAAPGTVAYQPLSWGAAPVGTPYAITECWRDATAPAALIARTKVHPGQGQDAVIAWRVIRGGLVQVDVALQPLRTAEGGDGIEASIWQGDTRISAPTLVPNDAGQQQTVTALRTMQAGEMVYLRINGKATVVDDWFTYTVAMTVS